jgi:hypothetical protein
MPVRRKARARRRIARRTAENLLRIEAAVTQAAEASKLLKTARTRTRLEEAMRSLSNSAMLAIGWRETGTDPASS